MTRCAEPALCECSAFFQFHSSLQGIANCQCPDRDGLALHANSCCPRVALVCHPVCCRELGKVLTGKLVVVTPGSEHTFIVRGRQPAYVPPSRAALPSSKFLTAGTVSSMAHSRSNSPAAVMRGSTSSPSGTGAAAAAAAHRTGGGSQGAATGVSSKNYLQQNIKAARAGAAGKSSGAHGQGASRQWA
jgi:hypothetical protein